MTDEITFDNLLDVYPIVSNKKATKCVRCSKENCELMVCSKCKSAAYCSPECQKADWAHHKHQCTLASKLRNIPPGFAKVPSFVFLSPASGSIVKMSLVLPPPPFPPCYKEGDPRFELVMRAKLSSGEKKEDEEEERYEDPDDCFLDEEEKDSRDSELDKIQKILEQRGALQSAMIPVANADTVLENLINPDEVIIEGEKVRFCLFYPVNTPVGFNCATSSGKITRGDLLIIINRMYQIVFSEPDNTFGTELFPIDALFLHSVYKYAENSWAVMVDS